MNKVKKNGNLIGLGSGAFWGFDTALIGLALTSPVFILFGNNASLVSTFLHDGVSFLFLFLIMIFGKQVKEFWNVLRSKAGITIMSAALLGGPIGMTGYILSINYLGVSLSSSISALYPIFGVILGFLFLKERLNLRSIIGILVSISAIVFMGFSAVGTIPNLGLGILCGVLCIIGWGSEAVIISVALKEDVPTNIALGIRQMVSCLTYAIIILPIINGYSALSSAPLTDPGFMIILVTGILGSISYLFYYKAISMIGPSRAMGLNISYPAWAFLFQCIIDQQFDVKTFILVLILIVGTILSTEDPKDLLPKFLKNKKISS